MLKIHGELKYICTIPVNIKLYMYLLNIFCVNVILQNNAFLSFLNLEGFHKIKKKLIYLLEKYNVLCLDLGLENNCKTTLNYEVRLKRNGTEVTDCATRLTISNQHFYSVA